MEMGEGRQGEKQGDQVSLLSTHIRENMGYGGGAIKWPNLVSRACFKLLRVAVHNSVLGRLKAHAGITGGKHPV